jgi:IMP dehydrogenase
MNKHIEKFMRKYAHEGLTFDDISLVTRYADFLPNETDISTRLSKRIKLNIPFVSAAMDTVTETNMAIGMAMLGGIGIIHKNLTIEEQAKQVGIVKHHLHGLIRDPIVFRTGDTVQKIIETKKKKNYKFTGFPILDDNDKLVGIITARDIKYLRNLNVKVETVMTRNLITAPPDTSLENAYKIMTKHRIGKLPLVEKGKLVGLYSFTDVKILVENVEPFYNRDKKYRLRVGAAVSHNDYERVEALADEEVDVIVIDSAHGHSRGIIEMTRWIKKNYPEIDVISGNVCTAEGAIALAKAGADAVKVGVGPGSICTTRVVCGVGVPQITAVYQCARALKGKVPVIADGGIRYSGDVPKALAVGADSVMLGSVLAGTEESPGEKIVHEGRQYVVYRGMGSLSALKAGLGSRKRYGMETVSTEELVPQGVEGIVPYAGPLKSVMQQFCGGLRASLGYCGCRTIPELQQNAMLVRVTQAGIAEAHPHDIKITRQAPNYPM